MHFCLVVIVISKKQKYGDMKKMSKIFVSSIVTLLIMGLSACSVGHSDVKKALENEGLKTEYTENVGEGSYELYIAEADSKLMINIMDNRSEVRELKKSLLENSKAKNYQVETFEAKNLLLVYYPSENRNKEVERKIRNAILKLK
jgi:preprotein translocase subunit SecF